MLGALAGATTAGTLTGCSWLAPVPPPPLPPDPLAPLLRSNRRLTGHYQAVLAVHPELTDLLSPLVAVHTAHAAVLLDLVRRPAATPPAGGWVQSPATNVPAEAADALAMLRAEEEAARDEAAQACLAAPPERAALLGSICAARASHVEVLS